MIRRYSIREDQENFRELVLNKKANHWQKANKMIVEHDDFKNMVSALHGYGIKEPYATNILMRTFQASWKVIERTK